MLNKNNKEYVFDAKSSNAIPFANVQVRITTQNEITLLMRWEVY